LHRLTTTDGASIAVHPMAGGPDLPPLLVSHATGFHAHCYQPVADALGDRYRVVGFDHRGHGESAPPPGWEVDWRAFGADTADVAHSIAPDGGLIGVGHSMGGASLLMAAYAEPTLFSHLVLFEPIAHPPHTSDIGDRDPRDLPIAQGALRRRRHFPSRQAAIDNYAAKPPMSLMIPEVLANYVDHGFRTVADDNGTEQIELRCLPEFEADVFMSAGNSGVWFLLHQIETPCTVIGGRVEEMQPSASTAQIAGALPNAEYVLLDHQTHFGPFSHPTEFASFVP
jgi:pimeloyl-ACP methyl ester carboxylesterase